MKKFLLGITFCSLSLFPVVRVEGQDTETYKYGNKLVYFCNYSSELSQQVRIFEDVTHHTVNPTPIREFYVPAASKGIPSCYKQYLRGWLRDNLNYNYDILIGNYQQYQPLSLSGRNVFWISFNNQGIINNQYIYNEEELEQRIILLPPHKLFQ